MGTVCNSGRQYISKILDLVSVIFGEYNILNALIDIPVELISITGVLLIFWTKNKDKSYNSEHLIQRVI